jgi:hypothetical protein
VEVIKQVPTEGIPDWCQEPVIAASAITGEVPRLSHTFEILHKEQWPLQDFFPTAKELVEIYPRKAEMKMMRLLRVARVALFALTVLGLAYFTFGTMEMMNRLAWKFQPSQATAVQARLAGLNTERQKIDHWSNLLQDRSKTWVAMESFARMFPENSGTLVKNYNHTVKTNQAPGQTKVGFVREWKIIGYAREEALAYLGTLNTTKGVSAHFAEIARETGNQSYDTTASTRSIQVNIRTQENSAFRRTPGMAINDMDENSYPYTFDLTISQRFEGTDPMALLVPKAP